MVIGIEDFMKTATSEQIQLLFNLSDLAEKENEIAEKINKIYSTVNKWPGIYSDGKGITLCEDEDDANVISIRHKLELQEVRDNIIRLLKKAINELGMENVGIIQRQYKNYVTAEQKEITERRCKKGV